MKEQKLSEELEILKSRLHYVNVYLNEALTLARIENEKGSLDLNKYVSKCGSKGCVAFYFAKLAGEPLMFSRHPSVIRQQVFNLLALMFDINKYEPIYDSTFSLFAGDVNNNPIVLCFAASEISLYLREEAMSKYRDELLAEIECMQYSSIAA